MKISRGRFLLLLGTILVIVDQIIKFLVKTDMTIGQHFSVIGDWFQILFIENEGMAFGMKFGGMAGKLVLTLLRIVLFSALCWWITSMVRHGRAVDTGKDGVKVYEPVSSGVLVGLTLITAGAMGNIIDCILYGQIFSESTPYQVAQFGGSYAPVFFGKVVDMFYFPLIDTHWPTWMPFVGGREFRFFEPVFNFADSCVTVGAFYLILFQYHFFASEGKSRAADKKTSESNR